MKKMILSQGGNEDSKKSRGKVAYVEVLAGSGQCSNASRSRALRA